jgi:hypothetical protein
VKTIYKYDVPMLDTVTMMMPVGAEVLSVGVQDGRIYLWAVVETTAPAMSRVFYVCGTGNPLNVGNARFIGTVQMDYFVWHVFEART